MIRCDKWKHFPCGSLSGGLSPNVVWETSRFDMRPLGLMPFPVQREGKQLALLPEKPRCFYQWLGTKPCCVQISF